MVTTLMKTVDSSNKVKMQKEQPKSLLVVDCETTGTNPHFAELLGVASYIDNKTDYLTLRSGNQTPALAVSDLFSLLQRNGKDKPFLIGHNAKYDSIILRRAGVAPFWVHYDTMIALYLLEIDKPRKLETAYERITGVKKKDLLEIYNETTGKELKNLPQKWYEEVPEERLQEYAKQDAAATFQLYEYTNKKLEGRLRDWFFQVEMPLVNILTEMELKGVKVDREKLNNFKLDLEKRRGNLQDKLRHLAGDPELNLNSPNQLQDVLFKKFKLQKGRKTKTGFSTDKKVLDKLKDTHAFPKLLLQFNEIDDLLAKFLGPLPEYMDRFDRIHCNYKQAWTKTRRFSCEEPNLQQIPSKTELGKKVRECFVPENGSYFLVADYDQVELRILAHLSEEPALIDAFNTGVDIHQRTADMMKVDRYLGKIFNFSIIYGKTAFGFAQDLNCSEKEAQELIDKYFSGLPKVREYIEDIRLQCIKNKGWLNTISGLPVYCGDPLTNSKAMREYVMRCAVDYRIQGSSQDILKKAVVNVYQHLGHVPVLMVHDELVFELESYCMEADAAIAAEIVGIMERAWNLKVPLKVSYKITERWEK